MSQANWTKFLADNNATSSDFDWAKSSQGLEAAWAVAPDAPALVWLALTSAGQDVAKRRAILHGLLDIITTHAALVVHPDVKMSFDVLLAQFIASLDHPEEDPGFSLLTNAVQAGLMTSNAALLASVKVRPFVLDPQFLIAGALCSLAQALSSETLGGSVISAQNGLSTMMGAWSHLGLVPASSTGEERTKKAVEMTRQRLVAYEIPAAATLLGL